MQISKRKVNNILEKQVDQMWNLMLVDIKTPQEAEKIMSAILTTTELSAISKRLAVGYWLTKKRSYENIKQNLKVSSATIAVVQQGLKSEGWKLALKKVMAEEWATFAEEKIRSMLKLKK